MGYTRAACELISWAGASWPFRQAAEGLRRFTFVQAEGREVERIVEVAGEWLDQQKRQEVQQQMASPVGPKELVCSRRSVEMDEDWVRRQPGKGKWQKAQVGRIFRQEEVGAKEGSGRGLISSARYVATFEGLARFGEEMWSEAVKAGLEHAQEVLVLTDGDRGLKELAALHFPGARHVLDWRHLATAVWETARERSPRARQAQKWARQVTSYLWSGQFQAAIRQVKRTESHTRTMKKHRKLHELLTYLGNNTALLANYNQLRRQGVYVSSAVAEKACDLVMSRRMKKKQAMFWGTCGPMPIARLRQVFLSDAWDIYWQKAA